MSLSSPCTRVLFLLLLLSSISFLSSFELVTDSTLPTFTSHNLQFSFSNDSSQFVVKSLSLPSFRLEQEFSRAGRWSGIVMPILDGWLTRFGFVKFWHYANNLQKFEKIAENRLQIESKVSWDSHVTMLVDVEVFSETRFTVKMKVNDPQHEHSYNRIATAFKVFDDSQGFFGFGERFNHVNQRGKQLYCFIEEFSWDLGWLEDPHSRKRFPAVETSTYTPIPFFITDRGYGILVNSPYITTFDLAHQHNNQFWMETETTEMEYTVFIGCPADVLQQYVELTGGPSLIPPAWEFGPWSQLGGEFTKEGHVIKDPLKALEKFISMDIPVSHSVHTVHFMPHQSQQGHEKELRELNEKMKEYGVRQTCYFNPFIQTDAPLYQEALAKDLFVKKDNGEIYTFVYHGTSNFECSPLDFTNPATIPFWHKLLSESVQLGFHGFMQDYGPEYLELSTKFANGQSGDSMHNVYALQYQQATFDFFKGLDPDPTDDYASDFVYYVRTGFIGSQTRTYAGWTGDPSSDWSFASGYPAQVAAMLNNGLAGLPFTGSDIGGFEWLTNRWFEPPSEELWIRWAQLGAFSGLMHDQTGGSGVMHNKTHILDTENGRHAWRMLSKFRTQLFPYIYTQAHIYRKTSMPIMRHHILSFPNDLESHKHSYQFMFGDSLLFAPVLDEGSTEWTVYLPGNGYWFDISSRLLYNATGNGRLRVGNIEESGVAVQGGNSVIVPVPLQEFPLFVKAGSIVALTDPSVFTLSRVLNGKITSYYDVEHVLHLWVFPNHDQPVKTTLFDGSEYTVADGVITFERPERFSNTSVHTVSLPCSDPQVKVIGENGAAYPSVKSVDEFYNAPLKRSGQEFYYLDFEYKQLLIRVESDTKIQIRQEKREEVQMN